MEELATAIVDGVSLFSQLFNAATDGGGNVMAIDQATMWESISSIVQNLAAFVTELAGEIASKI